MSEAVNTRKDAVTIFMARIKQAYIDNQKASGIFASGKSAASLRYTAEPTLGQLFGADYFAYQKLGRRPGKFPPIGNLIEWVKIKLGITDEAKATGVGYAIRNKIAKQGTDIYLKKRPPLSIEEKLLEARKELALNLLSIEKDKIKEQFNRNNKK